MPSAVIFSTCSTNSLSSSNGIPSERVMTYLYSKLLLARSSALFLRPVFISVPPSGSILSMAALMESAFLLAWERGATTLAESEKETTPMKSFSVKASTQDLAPALACSIDGPDMEPETSMLRTTAFSLEPST